MTNPATNSYLAPIAPLIGLTSPTNDVPDLLTRYSVYASTILDFSPGNWGEDTRQWPLVGYVALDDNSTITMDTVPIRVPAGTVVWVVEDEHLVEGGILFMPKTLNPRQAPERAH